MGLQPHQKFHRALRIWWLIYSCQRQAEVMGSRKLCNSMWFPRTEWVRGVQAGVGKKDNVSSVV